jgi:hypothetical protein
VTPFSGRHHAGGDSDSTGSIAGNLFGVMAGVQNLPKDFVDPLECRDLILEVPNDFEDEMSGPAPRAHLGPELHSEPPRSIRGIRWNFPVELEQQEGPELFARGL